jgi:hypothetical protein
VNQRQQKRSVLPEKEEYLNFLIFVSGLLTILTFFMWVWKGIF